MAGQNGNGVRDHRRHSDDDEEVARLSVPKNANFYPTKNPTPEEIAEANATAEGMHQIRAYLSERARQKLFPDEPSLPANRDELELLFNEPLTKKLKKLKGGRPIKKGVRRLPVKAVPKLALLVRAFAWLDKVERYMRDRKTALAVDAMIGTYGAIATLDRLSAEARAAYKQRAKSSKGGKGRAAQLRAGIEVHRSIAERKWKDDPFEHRTLRMADAVIADDEHKATPKHHDCDRRRVADHIRDLNPNK